jgi:hypothetical protein
MLEQNLGKHTIPRSVFVAYIKSLHVQSTDVDPVGTQSGGDHATHDLFITPSIAMKILDFSNRVMYGAGITFQVITRKIIFLFIFINVYSTACK